MIPKIKFNKELAARCRQRGYIRRVAGSAATAPLIPHHSSLIMIDKNKKVAFFCDLVPPYRLSFFEKTNESLHGNFYVFASNDITTNGATTGYGDNGTEQFPFPVSPAPIKKVRVPFFNVQWTWQSKVVKTLFDRDFSSIVLLMQMTRIDVWIVLFLNLFAGKKVFLWGHALHPCRDSWFSKKIPSVHKLV